MPAHVAVERGHFGCLQLVLAAYPAAMMSQTTVRARRVECGRMTDCVCVCCAARARQSGATPLYLAAHSGRTDIVSWLLAQEGGAAAAAAADEVRRRVPRLLAAAAV